LHIFGDVGSCFFCFNLAEAQKHYKEDANFKNFFLLNRHRIKTEYLSKNLGSLLVILVFPVAWWVAHTDRTVFDPLNQGDNCEGDIVFGLLGVYTMIFACIFSYLAYNLVGSMDNFEIKEELKITAVIGVLTFIPWILFNVQSDMANVNANVFPFSTLCLNIAAVVAFYMSTVAPVGKSFEEEKMKLSIPEAVGDLSNLEGILSTKLSRDVFRTFLANVTLAFELFTCFFHDNDPLGMEQ